MVAFLVAFLQNHPKERYPRKTHAQLSDAGFNNMSILLYCGWSCSCRLPLHQYCCCSAKRLLAPLQEGRESISFPLLKENTPDLALLATVAAEDRISQIPQPRIPEPIPALPQNLPRFGTIQHILLAVTRGPKAMCQNRRPPKWLHFCVWSKGTNSNSHTQV